jgi:hypothetical protein
MCARNRGKWQMQPAQSTFGQSTQVVRWQVLGGRKAQERPGQSLQLRLVDPCAGSIGSEANTMTFKVGDRAQRKEMGAYLQLSFPGTETGTVVSVREYSDPDVRVHLDIRLDNGEVLRSMADHKFEPVPQSGTAEL